MEGMRGKGGGGGGRGSEIVRCTETINFKGERVIALLFQPIFSQTVLRTLSIGRDSNPSIAVKN
jgi:hypothetical protein